VATFTLEKPDVFPNTTVVKVYPRSSYHPQAQVGAPVGAKVTEATMTSGKAEFTGLTAGASYVAYAEVGGTDTYLTFTVNPAAAASSSSSFARPEANGLLAWTFDPVVASGTAILAGAGTLHVIKIPVLEATRISNIHMWMTTKGATLTASENGLGLFDQTRKLIGKAAIASTITAWEGSTGEVKLALEEAVNVSSGSLYVGAYYKGTTAPTFAAAPSTIGVVNANVKESGSRFFTGDTSLTTALPSTITASGTAVSKPIWCGLS